MSSLNKKFPRLLPEPIRKGMKVADLIDTSFKAYNGGRLAEACRLFTGKMIAGDGIVGLSLTGALTPAGLGRSAIVPLLKELGYAGLGGAVGDGAMASALEKDGLKFFNGYLTLSFHAARPALDDRLRAQIDAMKGHDTALWLAVAKVQDDQRAFPNSSPDGDEIALAKLREIADYAEPRGVKIALYPHATLWLERVEDGVRVAEKLNRPSVGATFNLCHWLKVEGSERDPAPVLKAALPRLMFVTINGADTGDTKAMNWDRLIQPLGAGTYDVAAFLRTVRAAGYTGPVGFQGYGIRAAPREVLTRTMAAWRQMSAPTPTLP